MLWTPVGLSKNIIMMINCLPFTLNKLSVFIIPLSPTEYSECSMMHSWADTNGESDSPLRWDCGVPKTGAK